MRPSAILDIVRSGEAFAEMVPEEIRGPACAGESKRKTTIDVVADKQAEAEEGGCAKGTTGDPSLGGEMTQFERQLAANEKAEHREIEITLPPPTPPPTNRKDGKCREKKEQLSKFKRQQLGSCLKCGYMSSQELCKACVILDDLNKNRPKIEVELDDEDEEASSSVRRKLEALELGRSIVEVDA